MSKLMSALIPINDFLYLLQLEEYNSSRYAALLPRFIFRRQLQVRDQLKVTKRIQQMRLVCLLQIMLTALYSGYLVSLTISPLESSQVIMLYTAITILNLILTPAHVLLTNLLMTPWYEHLKSSKEHIAQDIVKKHGDLKIVAITGSYGKTTVKTILYQIIKNNYRVQFTPGNINTPTGIAQWLIDKLQPNTELLIIEMDAYQRGEIARACHITPPDIALITNFGDQHLERFGSHHNLTQAYLEAFTNSQPNAKLLLSSNESQRVKNYPDLLQTLNQLTIKQVPSDYTDILPKHLQELPESIKINCLYAVTIAQQLNIPAEIINHALGEIQLPDRRGDTKLIDGYTVIDRSYNISEATARQAVAEAYQIALKSNKKLLVITAGIPERGDESQKVNTNYGQYLKDYAKYIILLQSIYADAIQSGWSNNKHCYSVSRMSEALQKLTTIAPSDQIIILMQPELTDLSY